MMALQNGKQSTNLLHSQPHIWNHIFSFINSMLLKCAIQLQIPDIINRHGAPMLLSELVEAHPISKERAPFLYRLMGILVHSGFFMKQTIFANKDQEDKEEGYLLAPPSRLLLKDEPLSIRPFLLAMLDPILMDPWHHISTWFQNDDENPFHTTHGSNFWDLAGQDPNLNRFFIEAMGSDTRLVTSVVLKHRGVFESLNSIVDVGGGIGTIAKSNAEDFSDVSCICFDLPHVVDGLVGSKNLSYVGGDMFESIPKSNAVFLKWMLHSWSDEECKKILLKCKEAIPSKENGGKVIIIDMVLKKGEGDKEFQETQLLFDMLIMTLTTGRERTKKDWAKLFFNVEFTHYKITPILGLRSPIEVYP